MQYTVQVWRGNMLIDDFTFQTAKSKTGALVTAGSSYLGHAMAGFLGCLMIAAGILTFFMWGRLLPRRS